VLVLDSCRRPGGGRRGWSLAHASGCDVDGLGSPLATRSRIRREFGRSPCSSYDGLPARRHENPTRGRGTHAGSPAPFWLYGIQAGSLDYVRAPVRCHPPFTALVYSSGCDGASWPTLAGMGAGHCAANKLHWRTRAAWRSLVSLLAEASDQTRRRSFRRTALPTRSRRK
jgi:hypothetical protein